MSLISWSPDAPVAVLIAALAAALLYVVPRLVRKKK
jgi:hypothetical protein